MNSYKKIKVCSKTDIGLVREKNEDSLLVIDDSSYNFDTAVHGYMFAVADGLGGHSGGEVASKLACDGLLKYYKPSEILPGISAEKLSQPETRISILGKLIREIDKSILKQAKKDCGCSDMGTTLSVMVLFREFALLAHVGDSRIYRLRNGILEQLTQDQTMAQLSVELGYIKQKETCCHPLRNVLLEALGQGIDEIQTRIEKVKTGDLYLLCSDGLYDLVPDRIIENILKENQNGLCCDRLVSEAVRRGGKDNVSVILVKVA